MKLVFISSLSYSGSTLLDLLLSCHSGIFGIGEIDALMDKNRRQKHLDDVHTVQCTCGEMMSKCAVWGPFTTWLNENLEADYSTKYRRMIDIMTEQYPPEPIIVDSSKYLVPLGNIVDHAEGMGLKESDIYVIHLMKDVRSFATSMKRSRNVSSFGEFGLFRTWHSFNRGISKYLEGTKVNHMQIGYEELCLYPEYCLRLLCDFIGVEFEPGMMDLKNSNSHLALGNMMRLDKKKSAEIYYDNRWFLEQGIHFKYWLMFWIRKYNQENVYQHTIANQKGARFKPH